MLVGLVIQVISVYINSYDLLRSVMHSVIAILLPLSLVMLVFGGICGLVSSLARSRTLLIGSASYFLLCSKFDPLNAMVTYCYQIKDTSLYVAFKKMFVSRKHKLLKCIHGWTYITINSFQSRDRLKEPEGKTSIDRTAEESCQFFICFQAADI